MTNVMSCEVLGCFITFLKWLFPPKSWCKKNPAFAARWYQTWLYICIELGASLPSFILQSSPLEFSKSPSLTQ